MIYQYRLASCFICDSKHSDLLPILAKKVSKVLEEISPMVRIRNNSKLDQRNLDDDEKWIRNE